jgi:HEAT repeat protein
MHAIPALVNTLALDRPTARRLAATALVAIGAPDARARLAALAANDPDPDVRRACAAAIATG